MIKNRQLKRATIIPANTLKKQNFKNQGQWIKLSNKVWDF